MPVHNIDMDIIRAGFVHRANGLAQSGEIGREN
jgi:hypothetical protein